VRKVRGLFIGYAIIALFAGWPILSVLAASFVASWNGCAVPEGFANRCVVFGAKFGGLLYSMGVLGWFMLMTLPLGAISLIAWTAIWVITRKRLAPRPGTTWARSDAASGQSWIAAARRWHPMQQVVPMIHVQNVRASVEWYKRIGFTVRGTNEPDGEMDWASLVLDNAEIMLTAGGCASAADRREVDLYIRTDDVDGLYNQLKERVKVRGV
jgi:hypothetical protein